MRVALVLYKLASFDECRWIANQFGVHKSTVKKMVYLFCHGMVDSSHQNTDPGCVDGSHIPCLPPSDGYRDFINRKGWPSYVLQGVCDDKYCFWSVSCKVPGSAQRQCTPPVQSVQQRTILPKESSADRGAGCGFLPAGRSCVPADALANEGVSAVPKTDTTRGKLQRLFEFC
uniref:DDE Tnp4 domain-containing protein n=1 Tax=Nothobranchius furzeri TaxID=105023 RepID=A0A1A8ADX0_NOTFU